MLTRIKNCIYLPGGGLHIHVLHSRGSTLYPCWQGLKHCLYLPGGGLHVHVSHPRGSTLYPCWQGLRHCLCGHDDCAGKW